MPIRYEHADTQYLQDCARAHFPKATIVSVAHDDDNELIHLAVDFADEPRRAYTFEIGSDDDNYVFVNDADADDVVTFDLMPE